MLGVIQSFEQGIFLFLGWPVLEEKSRTNMFVLTNLHKHHAGKVKQELFDVALYIAGIGTKFAASTKILMICAILTLHLNDS